LEIQSCGGRWVRSAFFVWMEQVGTVWHWLARGAVRLAMVVRAVTGCRDFQHEFVFGIQVGFFGAYCLLRIWARGCALAARLAQRRWEFAVFEREMRAIFFIFPLEGLRAEPLFAHGKILEHWVVICDDASDHLDMSTKRRLSVRPLFPSHPEGRIGDARRACKAKVSRNRKHLLVRLGGGVTLDLRVRADYLGVRCMTMRMSSFLKGRKSSSPS